MWYVKSIKWLEKQLTYLGALGDLRESNSLRSPFPSGTSCDDCQHQFMVVACPSLNILGKISASWDWVSSTAAAIPKISSFVDAHFVSHLGRHECPRLTLSLLFSLSAGALPSTPVLIHFTTGGENSSSVAGQKVKPITICVMTQFVLLWVLLYYGFCCIITKENCGIYDILHEEFEI